MTNVAFVAVTPRPSAGSRASVTVAGTVVDSHTNPTYTAFLTAEYQLSDASGHVLQGGPVALKPAGGTDATFTVSLPANLFPAGQTTTIAIRATDQDNGSTSGVTARTGLSVTSNPSPGSVDAVFSQAGTGGYFDGYGHGGVSIVRNSRGSIGIVGNGTFAADASSDVSPVHTNGQGTFRFLSDPKGEVHATFAARQAKLRLAAIPQGGLDTSMQGRISILRDVDTSIALRSAGRILPTSASVQGGGQGRLSLLTDGKGGYQLKLGGQLAIRGSVHPGGPPKLF